MKTVVLYRSKSGFVKRYAEWIAEALQADLFEASKFNPKLLNVYDTIIYGGGLYAVGINGVKLIKDNLRKLQGKKVIVFATGASYSTEKVYNEVRDKNFTEAEQKQIRFFYMQGGFDFNKMKPIDKVLMSMMKRMLKGKKDRTPEDDEFLAAYDQPTDFTAKEKIEDLLAYARSEA